MIIATETCLVSYIPRCLFVNKEMQLYVSWYYGKIHRVSSDTGTWWSACDLINVVSLCRHSLTKLRIRSNAVLPIFGKANFILKWGTAWGEYLFRPYAINKEITWIVCDAFIFMIRRSMVSSLNAEPQTESAPPTLYTWRKIWAGPDCLLK